VGLDGGLADHEPLGDLAVPQALSEQGEYLALALAQVRERIGRRLLGGAYEVAQEPGRPGPRRPSRAPPPERIASSTPD
jgi:hypothetical protein